MIHKSSRKILMLVIVLLLLIGGSAWSYFYFQQKNLRDENGSTEEPDKPKVQIVDEDSSNRPYGVMINNISVARPYHSGLMDAYLVYEMIVEGGITRYYALFSDTNTNRIGPIRSARPYYLDYAMENDAYFVHWGFSDQAKSDISKYRIQNINGLYQGNYFWKDQTLPVATEHTAFTSMEKLKNAVSELDYRIQRNEDFLLSYSTDAIHFENDENAVIANSVLIPYSNGTITSYRYDEATNRYLRFVNDVPHTDYVTKDQYSVKNIITYQVKNYSIDSYGRQTLENIGSGTGYYITNGYAVPIKWSKKTREAQTKYTYLDGTEIQVNDGNTWIQIQPENQKLTIS